MNSQFSLFINKPSMIYLKLHARIIKQLHKAQGAIISSVALFKSLFLLIFMDDFYQLWFISISAL